MCSIYISVSYLDFMYLIFFAFVEYAEMPQVLVTGFVFVCLTVLIHGDTGRETASKLHTKT